MYGQFKQQESKLGTSKKFMEAERRIQGSVLKELLKTGTDNTGDDDKVDLTYTSKV